MSSLPKMKQPMLKKQKVNESKSDNDILLDQARALSQSMDDSSSDEEDQAQGNVSQAATIYVALCDLIQDMQRQMVFLRGGLAQLEISIDQQFEQHSP